MTFQRFNVPTFITPILFYPSLLPVMSERSPAPLNRKSEIGNRKSLLLVAVLLAALALLSHPTTAQEPERLATSAPAPLAGAENVVLVSQAVDAVLVRNESGTWRADNKAVIRLHNSSRTSEAAISFGWPGWPGGSLTFNPTQLSGFAPYRAEGPMPTRTEVHSTQWAGETRDSTWVVADTTIGRDQRQRIFFDWSQPLGRGPLITYDFGLIPGSAWTDVLGSARVTLTLPDLSSEEIIVRAEPPGYTFNGTQIEWIIVEEEPAVNPSVTLIAPHLWQEIELQRANAATDPFGASLRLAELYDALAAAGVTEYGDEAIAALEAARRAQPENPEPLRRLANRYRQEAEARGGDLALLEQAATAAEAAFAVGLDDPALRDALVRDLQTLAEAWLLRDPRVSLDFLTRAEAASPDPAALAARRRAAAEGVALAALQRGDLAEAREIAESYALPLDFAPLPFLDSATARIENRPDERIVSFTVSGDDSTASRFADLTRRLVQGNVNATWDGTTLTLVFHGSSDAWLRDGSIIAQALDNTPELDLLRDVLNPAELQYRTVDDPFQLRYGYRETLRIQTRAGETASYLRQEGAARESPWERALLDAAATQWQTLYDSQRVRIVTQFEAGGQPTVREWAVAVPAQDRIEWQGVLPNRTRWLLAGAAAAGLLLLILALIWLPGRRS